MSRQRLRWLLTASHVPPSGAGGGMVRYAVSVARALADREDIELHVVAAADAVSFFVDDLGLPSAAVHHVSPMVLVASLEQRLGRVGVDLSTFDVVHGTKHLLPHRPRGARGVWLLTVHDLLVFQRADDYSRQKRLLLPREYRASLRAADAVVCVSKAVAAQVVESFPDLRASCVAVPLALSGELRDAKPVPVAGLESGGFALVVGDASPRKNLRFVVNLWPAVRALVPGAVLASVGPRGWGIEAGVEDLERLAAGGQACRLEGLTDGELRWAYEHAAVLLCPSLREGFGLPAAEARSFGLPVVSSPDPALAEAAGGHALVVMLDDPRGWVDAIVEVWGRRGGTAGTASRTWSDVAEETVRCARAAAGSVGLGRRRR